ncbi:hypothetical protein TNIN_268181 [Trichonephila inaurata madagascariensis]|uniref:Uncharacterized protein n=1 Tax=Trichonephila inaurata madagascariensis TaxID=2747483 RepID=A0A8X7CFA9_9ARAC|nr:hypothetical protein TNIN_268181 [Trichonephila inaurata madagascariensis]
MVLWAIYGLTQLSDETHEVEDFDPSSRRHKFKDFVHVLHMKPYHGPDAQDSTAMKREKKFLLRRHPKVSFNNHTLVL